MKRRQFIANSALWSTTFLLGTSEAVAADSEEPTAVDIGFCTDMTVHHLQALSMCQRVLGRDTGDAVQAAAAEVLQNQAMEVGQMRAWLADWGASTVFPELVMGWMGMNEGVGIPLAKMPGYATNAELLELSTRKGRDRGRRWIELMRAHHVGGVMMATKAQSLASSEKVIRLAKGQIKAQTYEIYQYDILLEGPYSL